jgi:hypothetical protein
MQRIPSNKVSKYLFSKNKVGLAVMLLLSMTACGGQPTMTSSGRSMLSGLQTVNDISKDPKAAAAVAAQTEIENGRAPGECLEILLNDPKDVFVNVNVESELEKMQAMLCSMRDEQLSTILKESHKYRGSRSHGFGLLVDTLSELGKNQLDLNYNQAETETYDDRMATSDSRTIRSVFCTDQSAEHFKTRAVESFKSVASSVTLDKYNACVRSKSYGLRCHVRQNAHIVTATIRWEPTELVRDYLPSVALSWSGLLNLATKQALPDVLGLGSGMTLSLERANKSENSVFAVTGSDRSGKFNFTCNTVVSPAAASDSSMVLRRDPSCGVERFKEASSPECGIESYQLTRSESCGVESYKEQSSPACGVERYHARHDCGICGQAGPIGGCRRCEHPSFGVAVYKSCRHHGHGVEQFAECRHIQHGVERYLSCRRDQFGVELYRQCLVQDLGLPSSSNILSL